MQASVTESPVPTATTSSLEKNRRFINAYWLRPENAFWMVLRSNALSRVPMRAPSIDLSCGDGVFSFLHAGGRFDPSFDVFEAVRDLERANTEHADVFDHVDDDYQPPIAREPDWRMDCGTDVKPSLLAKASRLGFYDRLLRQDHNERLPFENDAFQTVYCNATYWVSEVDAFLREIGRITAPGGTIVLQVKLDAIKQFTFEKHREVLGDHWLHLMGRGRLETWPGLCDRRSWERHFAAAGLDVQRADAFVTGTHAHVWDIGLRPIAPMLIKTMNSIHAHLRKEIKRDWVDLFCDLLAPFCKADLDLFTEPSEPVEMQYELTPRR